MIVETAKYLESNGKYTRHIIFSGRVGPWCWYAMLFWLGRKVQSWSQFEFCWTRLFVRVYPVCVSAAAWKSPRFYNVTLEGLGAIQELLGRE